MIRGVSLLRGCGGVVASLGTVVGGCPVSVLRASWCVLGRFSGVRITKETKWELRNF